MTALKPCVNRWNHSFLHISSATKIWCLTRSQSCSSFSLSSSPLTPLKALWLRSASKTTSPKAHKLKPTNWRQTQKVTWAVIVTCTRTSRLQIWRKIVASFSTTLATLLTLNRARLTLKHHSFSTQMKSTIRKISSAITRATSRITKKPSHVWLRALVSSSCSTRASQLIQASKTLACLTHSSRWRTETYHSEHI